jgi:predicted dehydrogenase
MALVGAGRWGTNHLRTLVASQEVEVAAICETDAVALASAGLITPSATLSQSFHALDLRGLDALIVASPTVTHAAFAQAALERGLHVLLEKPLCARPSEVAPVLDAARRSGRTLMLGCQMLHHPAYRALLDLAPALEAQSVRTLRASHPRAGSDGILEALAPHDLATVVSLLEAVRPGARVQVEGALIERDGTLVAHLLSDPSGLSFELRWARSVGPVVRSTTVAGTRGSVTLDEASGRLSVGRCDTLATGVTPLSLQLSAFVRRIRGLPAVGLTLEQIETVAHLADAIERSAAEHGLPLAQRRESALESQTSAH